MKKTTNPTSALIKQDAQKIEEIETRYLGVIKKMEKELATINCMPIIIYLFIYLPTVSHFLSSPLSAWRTA